MAKIPYDKTAEIVQAAREMIAGRDEWECRQERAIVALADENARLREEISLSRESDGRVYADLLATREALNAAYSVLREVDPRSLAEDLRFRLYINALPLIRAALQAGTAPG